MKTDKKSRYSEDLLDAGYPQSMCYPIFKKGDVVWFCHEFSEKLVEIENNEEYLLVPNVWKLVLESEAIDSREGWCYETSETDDKTPQIYLYSCEKEALEAFLKKLRKEYRKYFLSVENVEGLIENLR